MESYWKEFLRIKELLAAHPRGMTVSELSRRLRITRNPVAKYLDVLLFTGQIEMKRVGQAKVYFISERIPLSSLLYLYSDPVMVLDNEGCIIFVNDALLELTAVSPEQVLRKEVAALEIPPANDPQLISALRNPPHKPLTLPNLLCVDRDRAVYLRVKFFPTVLEGGTPGTSIVFEDVTEQKRIDEAFRASRERYRLLVENSPDMIAIHDEEEYLYINPAGLALLGAETPDEILGQPVARFLHPDFHDVAMMQIDQLQSRDGRIPPVEVKMLRLDGTVVAAEGSGHSFVHDGKKLMQIVVRDITERKRMEEAVRASEAWMRALLNAPRDPALLIDRDGTILALNEVAATRFGRRVEDLSGRRLDTLLPHDPVVAGKEQIEKVFASGRSLCFSIELDGIIFDIILFPIRDAQGDVQQIAIFARDVTTQKRLEEIRKQACDRIQQSVNALIAQSDNVRQPLQVILALADLIDDERISWKIREQIMRINDIIMEIDRGRVEFCEIRESLRRVGPDWKRDAPDA